MNQRMKQLGCLLAVSMLFSGCVAEKKATPAAQPEPAQQTAAAPEAQPAAPAPKHVAKAKPAAKAAAATLPAKPCDLYSVEVSSDKASLGVGDTTSLYVHVKASDFPLTGHEAHGVKVTFSGLGFVSNPPAVECLRVHPNGSLIIYNVTAANAGTYDVVANVAFYPTRDCNVSRVTKASNPLTVTVK